MFLDTVYPFLKLFNLIFIKGSFISLLLIIISHLVFKNKLQTKIPSAIFKWLLIINAALSLIFYAAEFAYAWYGGVEYEQYSFSERMNGPYAGIYWFLLIAYLFLPFVLLIKRLGKNIYCVLGVAILVNIGWLFESLVIHTTAMHRDYVSSERAYLPFTDEWWTIGYGLIWGVVAILIGYFISKLKRKALVATGL
jgi:hypothetical protein